MPVCQRRVTLGDGGEYFKSTLEQAGTLNGTATGTAAQSGKARTDPSSSRGPICPRGLQRNPESIIAATCRKRLTPG